MDSQETPPSDQNDEQAVDARIARLEARVEHLEREMQSIAKMEKVLTGFLGRGKSGD